PAAADIAKLPLTVSVPIELPGERKPPLMVVLPTLPVPMSVPPLTVTLPAVPLTTRRPLFSVTLPTVPKTARAVPPPCTVNGEFGSDESAATFNKPCDTVHGSTALLVPASVQVVLSTFWKVLKP